ncbi:hypothetical protein CAPTEDRAFT_121359, partial [Capitella teleta]
DACYTTRCYNGLTCVVDPNESNGYRCEGECNPGFLGSDCRSRNDFAQGCTRKPCQNSGWCVQTGINHVCRCRLGYSGDECQYRKKCNAGVCVDDDACSSDPCLNGGTCTLSENSFNCECPENFEGEHCETEC